MQHHSSKPSPSNLQPLSAANPFSRLFESLVGSPRSDAINIIRGAQFDNWDVTLTSPRSLTIGSSRGVVRFQYDGLKLSSVHITTQNSSLDLEGSCEMARHLHKVAQAAFKRIYVYAVSKTEEIVKSLLAGRASYDVTSADYERTSADGLWANSTENDYRDTGHIRTRYGGVSLYSHKAPATYEPAPQREVRFVKNDRYEDRHAEPWQQEMVRRMAGDWTPDLTPRQPQYFEFEVGRRPTPRLSASGARSYFSDDRVETIRLLLGTQLGKGEARIDLPEGMVLKALAWAKNNQGRFRR